MAGPNFELPAVQWAGHHAIFQPTPIQRCPRVGTSGVDRRDLPPGKEQRDRPFIDLDRIAFALDKI